MLNHLFCRISTRYSYIPFFLSNSNKIQHNLSQYPPKQNHKRFSHTLINRHQKTETPSEIKRPVSPLTSKEHKSTSRRGTQRQIENILFIPAYERLPKKTTDYPHKIANFFPTSDRPRESFPGRPLFLPPTAVGGLADDTHQTGQCKNTHTHIEGNKSRESASGASCRRAASVSRGRRPAGASGVGTLTGEPPRTGALRPPRPPPASPWRHVWSLPETGSRRHCCLRPVAGVIDSGVWRSEGRGNLKSWLDRGDCP